jgi:hypothetical protein
MVGLQNNRSHPFVGSCLSRLSVVDSTLKHAGKGMDVQIDRAI